MVLKNFADISNIIIGMTRSKMINQNQKTTLKVMKSRYNVEPTPEVIERPDHFALKADGWGMPTEHTSKVLAWLESSGLKHFKGDSHFGEIRIHFFKVKDAAVFKLFWVK